MKSRLDTVGSAGLPGTGWRNLEDLPFLNSKRLEFCRRESSGVCEVECEKEADQVGCVWVWKDCWGNKRFSFHLLQENNLELEKRTRKSTTLAHFRMCFFDIFDRTTIKCQSSSLSEAPKHRNNPVHAA